MVASKLTKSTCSYHGDRREQRQDKPSVVKKQIMPIKLREASRCDNRVE
jgi:hypothetical protein